MRSKNYPFVIVLTLLSSIFTTAEAQNKKGLTLDEAIQLSLLNSKELKLNQEKINEANAALRQATEGRLPDLKANGAYLRMHNPDITLKLKSSPSSSSESSIKANTAEYAIISASLPLFAGFRIKYGIESAKYLAEAVRLDAESDRESMIQNTIAAYCNLYKAQQQVTLIGQNLEESQRRVADFRIQQKNGVVVLNDLLKVELEETNSELSLLDAQNNLKMTCLNMNIMLGLPERTELTTDSTSFQTLNEVGDIAIWEENALQNRREINALNMREKASVTNIKGIRADYYPGISLTGGYIAANIPNLLTVTNAYNIGIGVQYKINSFWKNQAKIAQAKSQEKQMLMNEEILSDQIRIQINQVYQDYVLDQKKIEVNRKALLQANENYKVTQGKYDNKVVITTDLLDADQSQLRAKLNYAFSKADALVAYNKLLLTAGLLSKLTSHNK
jgi:outer membrane protein